MKLVHGSLLALSTHKNLKCNPTTTMKQFPRPLKSRPQNLGAYLGGTQQISDLLAVDLHGLGFRLKFIV